MITRYYEAVKEVIVPEGHKLVFLAGSIEMDRAERWQDAITDRILANDKLDKVIIANPRRRDWNDTLTQEFKDVGFKEHVEWELSNIEKADIVVVYFDGKTTSPITLMELGIMSQTKPDKVVVLCPPEYYRKGNVDITCNRYGVKTVNNIDEMIRFIEEKV